jgi:hypothetical protein
MKAMKFYLILCGVIFFIGAGIAIFTTEFPDTTVSGEMPPAFGAGVGIAVLTVVGFAAGLIVKVVLAVIKYKRQ